MNKEDPTDLTKEMQSFIDCINTHIQQQKKESKILDIMLFIGLCIFFVLLCLLIVLIVSIVK